MKRCLYAVIMLMESFASLVVYAYGAVSLLCWGRYGLFSVLDMFSWPALQWVAPKVGCLLVTWFLINYVQARRHPQGVDAWLHDRARDLRRVTFGLLGREHTVPGSGGTP